MRKKTGRKFALQILGTPVSMSLGSVLSVSVTKITNTKFNSTSSHHNGSSYVKSILVTTKRVTVRLQ